MENVPKIVLDRLQSAPAEPHPDADLLTAFAEQSLPESEHALVLRHLARCGDCREAVALALPAQVELPQPAVSGASWFRWPVLRWAAVAAGVAIIASIGTLQYRRQHPAELASNVSYAKPAITISAPSPQPSSEAAIPQTGMRKEALAASRAQTVSPESKPASSASNSIHRRTDFGGAIRGSSAGAVIGPGQGLNVAPRRESVVVSGLTNPQPTPTQQANAPSGPGQSSQVVEVQSEASPINTETSALTQSQDELAQNQKELPLQGRAVNRVIKDLDVVRAKDALPAQATSSRASAAAPGVSPQMSQALMLRASPRWTISSDGALQRSFDGGKTWEGVNPNANPASAASFEVVESDSRTDQYRADLKKSQKAEAPLNPSPVFRAVAATAAGLEVWAGGSRGVLYHTADGGNLWARVVPSDAGSILTADITSVEFSDTQHGRIVTSNAEVWSTTDDGQTWHKQR
jgi:hypothetical protein